VIIIQSEVIYDLIDDVKMALEAKLVPEQVVIELGQMQVLALFKKEQQWAVVGGKVLRGTIATNNAVNIFRKGEQIGEGVVKEIRVGKEIVDQVEMGQEAGVKVSGFVDIEESDVLEFSREEERKRTLDSVPLSS
jgi:translation initiation factor IF-2